MTSNEQLELRALLLEINRYLRASIGVPAGYEGTPRSLLLEGIASTLTRIDSSPVEPTACTEFVPVHPYACANCGVTRDRHSENGNEVRRD